MIAIEQRGMYCSIVAALALIDRVLCLCADSVPCDKFSFGFKQRTATTVDLVLDASSCVRCSSASTPEAAAATAASSPASRV